MSAPILFSKTQRESPSVKTANFPTIHIRATFLSQKPRKDSRSIAISSVLFIFLTSYLAWQNLGGWNALLPAIPQKVFQEHEYWRLFTACFIHKDIEHFFGNALFFGVLSYMLYGYFGFWIHPFLSVLLGAITNYFTLMTYEPHIRLVGASGMVYAMAGFWLMLFLCIDRRHSVMGRSLRCFGFFLVLLVPESYSPSISYQAHAIGLLLGLVCGIGYFLWNRAWIRSFERIEMETPEPEVEHEPLTH